MGSRTTKNIKSRSELKTTENRCCSRPTHLRGCIWSLVNDGDVDVDYGTGDDDYDDNDS